MTLYFSFLALSCQPCLIAPCSAFKNFYFPDFELDIGVISLLTNLHHFNPFFTSTPLFFLLYLLCSQPQSFSKTPIVTLLYMYLLASLLTIYFLVTFATEPLLYLSFSLIFGIWYAIFGTLYIDV